jgi:anti-sigma factor RsiW
MAHIADNHEALLDYLYEEGDPAERLMIARHLQECASCSVAVLEFQNVRGMLRDWTPPVSDLGFRLVQEGQSLPAPPRASAFQRFGAWAQAAAAVVLFAAGMAVSQLTVDYSNGAVVVRTKSAAAPASMQAAAAGGAPVASPVERAGSVDTASAVRPVAAPVEPPAAASIDTEQLLQRVRAMIDQSEQRQQRELALRLAHLASEVDTQHQADLLKIQQNLGQQQDDFMNYLVRTGGPK